MMEATVFALRRDWDATANWPLDELRKEMNRRPYPQGIVKKVTLLDESLGGINVTRFSSKSNEKSKGGTAKSNAKVILFLHGGSFIFGSARTTHAEAIARIALASGLDVIAPEVRFAPEHPYPAQLEDARAVFDALVASGVSASNIILVGDSAGGNLALALQIDLRDRSSLQSQQASALVLLSPWTDLTMPGKSYRDNEPFDFGTRDVLVRHARAYTGGGDDDDDGGIATKDPRVSPTYAKLEGLSPVFVALGDAELLRDDIDDLAKRLRSAGVDVTKHVSKDMPHNAAFFAAFHPSGEDLIDAIATYCTLRS